MIESLASLSMVELKSPEKAETIRQYLQENILSLQEPAQRMRAWIAVLKASGGWDAKI